MTAVGPVASPMTYVLLAATVLLAVLTVVLVVVAIRAGLFKASAPASASAEAPRAGPGAKVARAVAVAVDELRQLVSGGPGPDDVPWVMVLGLGGDALQGLLPPPLENMPAAAISWLNPNTREMVGALSFHEGGVIVSFSDGLLGDPGWRPRLTAVLRALDLKKPGRPLDSLVIVLPYERLLAGEDTLTRAGSEAYEAILTIQRRTGWRLPIQLLVNGCDALPGFAEWRRASAARGGDQILGWPVPHALDSVFQARWVDEAIASMVEALSAQTFYLLMSQRGAEAAESSEHIFLLPNHLLETKAALRAYLRAMLRKSAYHEEFMLRGLYLIGGPSAVSEALAAQDLFVERIFVEHRLAQPAYGEMTRRHRQIRATQWALAGLGVALAGGLAGVVWFGETQIPKVQDLLCGVWVETPGGPRHTPGCERVDESASAASTTDHAVHLLDFMARVDTDDVDTVLAPTSYLTGIPALVTEAINTGYGVTVFRAISNAMTTQPGLEALLSRGADPRDPQQTWSKTVDNLKDYIKYYGIARSLDSDEVSRGKLLAFMELVSYSLNKTLPDTFAQNYDLYARGLANSRIVGLANPATRAMLFQIVQQRFNAAICEGYTKNPVVQAYGNKAFPEDCPSLAVEENAPGATFATQPVPFGADVVLSEIEPALGDLEPYAPVNLLDRLTIIDHELASADGKGRYRYDWIFSDGTVNEAAEKVSQLPIGPFLSRGVISAWSAVARSEEQSARRMLQAARVGGALLLVSDNGHARLSAPMSQTEKTLQALYAESFVEPGEENATAPLPGRRIEWNTEMVMRAEQSVEAFAAFTANLGGGDGKPDDIPPTLQALIRQTARNHLVNHVDALMRSAARPMDSSASGLELASLESALPMLVNVRDALRQAGAITPAASLDERLAERAAALLRDLDGQLASEAPYRLPDGRLPSPLGGGLVAERAFRADTHDDLKVSLVERRGQVAVLAQKARPLVDYLLDPATRPGAGALALARRWQSIARALSGAASGDANSSVLRLEQFILVDMDKVQPPDCPQTARGGATDYFSQQLQILRVAVVESCFGAAKQSLADEYRALALDFNESFHLAGRFPFSGASSDVQAVDGADPQAVRLFFAKWGADLTSLSTRLTSDPSQGAAGQQAVDFLTRLEKVRLALAPLVAGPPDAPLAYRVNVAFSTDHSLAVAQEQVFEVVIGAGDAPHASIADSIPALQRPSFDWRNGEPINITLRWALNAATLPNPTQAGRWPSVDGAYGEYARFRVEGDWALLRLISRAGGAASKLGAPGAIVLEAPLRPNPAAAVVRGAVVRQARVFMRLSLSTPPGAPGQGDKATPVSLPVFPVLAPDLSGTSSLAMTASR